MATNVERAYAGAAAFGFGALAGLGIFAAMEAPTGKYESQVVNCADLLDPPYQATKFEKECSQYVADIPTIVTMPENVTNSIGGPDLVHTQHLPDAKAFFAQHIQEAKKTDAENNAIVAIIAASGVMAVTAAAGIKLFNNSHRLPEVTPIQGETDREPSDA